uniref:Uncharacterized protein n=1 Tax=Anopheles quadriannulatus TaxID=34691 RepID=A0A182XBI2_ANOQN
MKRIIQIELISSGSSSSTSINVEQKSTSGSSGGSTTTTSAPPVPFRSFSTIPPPSAQHLIRLNTIEEARKREEAKQSACPCICS